MYVCVHVDIPVVFFLPEMENKVEYILWRPEQLE